MYRVTTIAVDAIVDAWTEGGWGSRLAKRFVLIIIENSVRGKETYEVHQSLSEDHRVYYNIDFIPYCLWNHRISDRAYSIHGCNLQTSKLDFCHCWGIRILHPGEQIKEKEEKPEEDSDFTYTVE